ncbi:DNA (cytosine-5-)-methyltransferase [Rubrobacter xylanophilus]|nr:DNA (cytosine-5-)-methyltransferase [Rubrobacter xylanophilus]
MIPNHYTASLSALDLTIAQAVPPGGNWKDIPETVPSKRLQQIRASYAAGKGSRSTYYGRLRPDAPAYTINTYFTRPGNGCHLHYDYSGGQHRTLSQREAARLQSFPDRFVFRGSHIAVSRQIGNAVPPLLAYQVARAIPTRGLFADLFSGAGGLSLGFQWAGWQPVVANDVDEAALLTYRDNIHDVIVLGDIREHHVIDAIIQKCEEARDASPNMPFFVLGGPPCQGFSTAGNRRFVGDERNWLFRQYKAVLERLQPDGFVFENVPGLLNMEGGSVFRAIRDELASTTKQLVVWRLRAEEYGVPQRRTRVILVGDSSGDVESEPPKTVTQLGNNMSLFNELPAAVSVRDALSDLPALRPGEDGSHKDYTHDPEHPYQEFVRGLIGPEEYLRALNDRL